MRALLLCNWIGNWDTLCLLCSRRWNFCPFATYILKHIVSVRAVTMQLDTFCLVVSSRRCDTFLKGPSLTFLSAPDHLLDKIVSKKPRNSFCPVTHFCFIALSWGHSRLALIYLAFMHIFLLTISDSKNYVAKL